MWRGIALQLGESYEFISGVRNACTLLLGAPLYAISLSKLENFSRTGKFQFLRGTTPLTRHTHPFEIPMPTSTKTAQLNTDKDLLRKQILEMREQGMSYRQIGAIVGLHWTRVGQIVKEKRGNNDEDNVD